MHLPARKDVIVTIGCELLRIEYIHELLRLATRDFIVVQSNLIDLFISLIEKEGSIPFNTFMEIALYHPEYGYYSSDREIIGKEGDYYTSSDVHPIFGWTLARYFINIWLKEGSPSEFHLLEIAPGKGFLSLDILDYIKKSAPEFLKSMKLILVERSSNMRERLKDTLSSYEGKVRIFEDFSRLDKITGIIFCNELFDALSVKRFVYKSGSWYEIMVTFKEGRFKEVRENVTNPFLLEVLLRYEDYIDEGMLVEWSPEAFRIIDSISKLLEKGHFLVFDYGDRREVLLTRFPKGSLAGYHKHIFRENLYERVGEQDITYHVDFTLLEEILKSSGFQILEYKDQGKFLVDSGITEVINECYDTKENLKARLAMKSLVLDFGVSHRVLISCK